MSSGKVETLVGLFVIVGLACFAYLALNLGGLSFLNNKQYTLLARFNNVGNLNVGAAVRIAGVSVGEVSDIKLDEQDFVAFVELSLPSGLTLDDDTIASIKSSGLIGDKYIDLTPGGSGIPYEAGEIIIDTESAVDIEGLISRFAFGGVDDK